MRLHHLAVTAFGPFAGTEEVDFDALNAAGLFLLTGATGAGKSSLLDAVCFALYGTVPGVRGVKALKSQHAAVGARPEVVLDFSVQGRRFVVRRSPEWTRPKRRGSGVLTEKASASILETTGDREHLLSSRGAEVGLLVGDLMGMNAGQFVQVALLPQGEFQTFLRASSTDRHDVLQQLFRTDRFARIEDWVGDHSRRLRERSDGGRTTVRRTVDTLADRLELEPGFDDEDLAVAAAEGRVSSWAATALDGARAEARSARERHDSAAARHRDARSHLERAVRDAERWERRASALGVLSRLADDEPEAARAAQRVEDHGRAVRCAPLLDLRSPAVDQQERAAASARRALSLVGAPPASGVRWARRTSGGALASLSALDGRAAPAAGDPVAEAVGPGDLTRLVEDAQHHLAELRALLPREAVAAAARLALRRDREHLEKAEDDLRRSERRLELLPGEIETLREELARVSVRAGRRAELVAARDTARERHLAAVRLGALQRDLHGLEESRRDARDRMQDARDHLQALVARRLAGMAAELAGQLRDGAACQVCGCTSHPSPARAEVDAVTEEDHRRADERLAEATARLDAAHGAVDGARRRRDALTTECGGLTAAEAADRVAALGSDLEESEAAVVEQSRLEGRLRTLRDELVASVDRRAAAGAAVAALRESVAAHTRVLDDVEAEVTVALADRTSSLSRTVEVWAAWCDRLADARGALAELEEADARLDSLTARVDAVASENGFAGANEVVGALLGPEVHDRLVQHLRDRAEQAAQARAVLDDPDLAGLEAGAHHDVARLTAEAAEAESAATEAARSLALLEDRVAAGAALLDRLEAAVRDWAPVRDESLRADAIARLVRGMGHDNQLQMRLSAYVLATRLDQVVAAANERLGHMRDRRYLLQRTDRAERRSAQAGLGLEVVDQWTGDVRAPSTLSGGETFVVSLALALGLADVVTYETGGTEVDTLFVDEGFGSLDADTLDDVMDRLDGLRAGGRTVGVVSHVTELRSRIPTQVHVEKGRSGSTVSLRTLVG